MVTNPPFSLFREYVAQLVEHGKKFLIIGNTNAITYKEIFPLIKDNKIVARLSRTSMAEMCSSKCRTTRKHFQHIDKERARKCASLQGVRAGTRTWTTAAATRSCPS